ncbi:TPA: DUF4158 domain-containing protein, partial [Escherichia coli]|nr:DUF4158 domain-containing protein [Escherichia coli]HAZ7423873.1 DUF4158 domain-containing protein [Escherichia coli]
HRIICEGNYMARRQILSLSDRESLLALPEDELTLTRMAYFSEHDLALISAHRKPASRFGFAVLLCYLKNVGFAPDKKIPPSDALLKHIASRLKLTGDHRPCLCPDASAGICVLSANQGSPRQEAVYQRESGPIPGTSVTDINDQPESERD